MNSNTIPAVFLKTCEKFSERPCLIYKKNHTFGFVPYKRLLNLVENFTFSLEKLGIQKHDRVILISENRPEWSVSDLSVKSLGAMLVPLHRVLTEQQIKSIVYETEPSLFIVSDEESFIKILNIGKDIKKDIPLIYLNLDLNKNEIQFVKPSYNFIEALQLIPHDNYSKEYRERIKALKAKETAAIMYTLDPTGKYRGVELSHYNLVSNTKDLLEAVKVRPEDKFLSVLPLSHTFEKTAGYYFALFSGAAISYVANLSLLSEIAKKEKPTIIMGVPRLYEKTYARFKEEANKNIVKKTVFNAALRYGKNKENRKKLLYKVFDNLVYKKVRDVFGGNIRFLGSGGAALKPEIGQFFDSVGLPILEGYGLTETSPIISVNRLENYRFGTVGQPLPRVKVKIANDGEILVKGPGVMKGYYKNGARPNETFINGWLRTGDIGEIDENGFLKITARKKEMIVLSTGKNVSPQGIEGKLNQSKFIHQSMVVGDGQKSIAALIVPDFENLKKIFDGENNESLLKSEEVKKIFQNEIDKQLKNLTHYEQVKQFIMIDTPFGTKNGLLAKDVRNLILKKHKTHIEKLYS